MASWQFMEGLYYANMLLGRVQYCRLVKVPAVLNKDPAPSSARLVEQVDMGTLEVLGHMRFTSSGSHPIAAYHLP